MSTYNSALEEFPHAVSNDRFNNLQKTQILDEQLEAETAKRFRLGVQKEDFIYQPNSRQFSFYQICQFAIDQKYKVRKVIFNELGEMLSYTEKYIEKNVLNNFVKKCPKFKYTIYPAYDLDIVGFPDSYEILTAQSHILNEY